MSRPVTCRWQSADAVVFGMDRMDPELETESSSEQRMETNNSSILGRIRAFASNPFSAVKEEERTREPLDLKSLTLLGASLSLFYFVEFHKQLRKYNLARVLALIPAFLALGYAQKKQRFIQPNNNVQDNSSLADAVRQISYKETELHDDLGSSELSEEDLHDTRDDWNYDYYRRESLPEWTNEPEPHSSDDQRSHDSKNRPVRSVTYEELRAQNRAKYNASPSPVPGPQSPLKYFSPTVPHASIGDREDN